jgi:hypothetical protein
MATYILKRKTYSDGDQQPKQGMGLGKKLAIGAGALGTAALAVAGARNGVFGTKAAIGANKAWMGADRALKSGKRMLNRFTK